MRMSTCSDPEAFGRSSSMEETAADEGGEDGPKPKSSMSFFKGFQRSQSSIATSVSITMPGSKRYFSPCYHKAGGLTTHYATRFRDFLCARTLHLILLSVLPCSQKLHRQSKKENLQSFLSKQVWLRYENPRVISELL